MEIEGVEQFRVHCITAKREYAIPDIFDSRDAAQAAADWRTQNREKEAKVRNPSFPLAPAVYVVKSRTVYHYETDWN